jgi:predicted PurR-regulated permease PerM
VTQSRSFAVWVVAVSLLAIVLLWAAYTARAALILIYISGLLAIGLSPLVRRIEHSRLLGRRVPRGLAILSIYVVVLGVIAAIIVMILPSLLDQARELWTALPEMFDRAQQRLVRYGLLRRPMTLRDAFERAPVGSSQAVNTVAGAATSIAAAAFGALTIAILTFYLLLDSQGLFTTFVSLFPRSRQGAVREASAEIAGKVSAWLSGQLILMAIIGASSAIVLGILGVPYFYVLALLSGVGELIPVVGPVIAAVPAIAVSVNESFGLALAVAVFFVVQQQFENHVIVPKVMEHQVGVSAVTVIVALLIGGALLGLVGAILAIPTAAILQVIYERARGDT